MFDLLATVTDNSSSNVQIAVATIISAGIVGAPAMYAAIQTRRTNRSVQIPKKNGDPAPTLGEKVADTHKLLDRIIRLEEYTHHRNHDIMNGQFRMSLMLFSLLKANGIDIPEPQPPEPWNGEERRTKDRSF